MPASRNTRMWWATFTGGVRSISAGAVAQEADDLDPLRRGQGAHLGPSQVALAKKSFLIKPGFSEQVQQGIVGVARHRRMASIEARAVLEEVPCEFAEPDPEKGMSREHRPRFLQQIDPDLHAELGGIGRESLHPAPAEGRRVRAGQPRGVEDDDIQAGGFRFAR